MVLNWLLMDHFDLCTTSRSKKVNKKNKVITDQLKGPVQGFLSVFEIF